MVGSDLITWTGEHGRVSLWALYSNHHLASDGMPEELIVYTDAGPVYYGMDVDAMFADDREPNSQPMIADNGSKLIVYRDPNEPTPKELR